MIHSKTAIMVILFVITLVMSISQARAQDEQDVIKLDEAIVQYGDQSVSPAGRLERLIKAVENAEYDELKNHWQGLIGIVISDEEYVLARESILTKLLDISPSESLRNQLFDAVRNTLLLQPAGQSVSPDTYQVATVLFVWYKNTAVHIDQQGTELIGHALDTYVGLGYLNPVSMSAITDPTLEKLFAAGFDTSDIVVACVINYGRQYQVIGSPLVKQIGDEDLRSLRDLVMGAELRDESYPYGAAALFADLGEIWYIEYVDTASYQSTDELLVKRLVGLKKYAEAQKAPNGVLGWLQEGQAVNAHDFQWAIQKAIDSRYPASAIRDAVKAAIRHVENGSKSHPAPDMAVAVYIDAAVDVLRNNGILSDQELARYPKMSSMK